MSTTESKPDSGYMLIRVYGGVEPKLFCKKIAPGVQALHTAVIDHLKDEPYDDEDGIFCLWMSHGRPVSVEAFSGGEMQRLRKASGEKL